jgi:hypothetical protein
LFVETPEFTRRATALLTEDEYRSLQLHLSLDPERGTVVPGGAGLRKIRWRRRGEGKRGGIRVAYYWARTNEVIYMLFAYAKSDQGDLTREQVRLLARHIREVFR